MGYLLYKIHGPDTGQRDNGFPRIPGEVIAFSPFDVRWFIPALRAGGLEYIKNILLALWCRLNVGSSTQAYRVWAYVDQAGAVLHYSIVLPTGMHMPWLDESEAGLEIGGCVTVPSARGKRIYPYVLGQITADADRGDAVYMIVDENNSASRAGMERAGFFVYRTLSRKSYSTRPAVYAEHFGESGR